MQRNSQPVIAVLNLEKICIKKFIIIKSICPSAASIKSQYVYKNKRNIQQTNTKCAWSYRTVSGRKIENQSLELKSNSLNPHPLQLMRIVLQVFG